MGATQLGALRVRLQCQPALRRRAARDDRFRRRDRSVGKRDIGALLFWKRLRADTRWARSLHDWADRDVRAITARAFGAARDPSWTLEASARGGRRELSALPGFRTGDALASAVLLAAAPDRMAVYDKRAEDGLRSLGLNLSSASGRYGRYISTIASLLACATDQQRHTWRPRDVDRALYWLGDEPEALDHPV